MLVNDDTISDQDVEIKRLKEKLRVQELKNKKQAHIIMEKDEEVEVEVRKVEEFKRSQAKYAETLSEHEAVINELQSVSECFQLKIVLDYFLE